MENARRTYEVLNSELHDELPALYDSRVLFLVTNMQTLFAAEEVFHSETAKVPQHTSSSISVTHARTHAVLLRGPFGQSFNCFEPVGVCLCV